MKNDKQLKNSSHIKGCEQDKTKGDTFEARKGRSSSLADIYSRDILFSKDSKKNPLSRLLPQKQRTRTIVKKNVVDKEGEWEYRKSKSLKEPSRINPRIARLKGILTEYLKRYIIVLTLLLLGKRSCP